MKGAAMSKMTDKMSEAGGGQPMTMDAGLASRPKKGDRFRCEKCGMALEVTADCRCQAPAHVHFHCCEQEMTRA